MEISLPPEEQVQFKFSQTNVGLALITITIIYLQLFLALLLKNNLKLSFFITGNTTGLLGYWDDSQESEFLRPDGTYLSTKSSLEVIHRDFGQLCTQLNIITK